jgi:hypothetical protein
MIVHMAMTSIKAISNPFGLHDAGLWHNLEELDYVNRNMVCAGSQGMSRIFGRFDGAY